MLQTHTSGGDNRSHYSLTKIHSAIQYLFLGAFASLAIINTARIFVDIPEYIDLGVVGMLNTNTASIFLGVITGAIAAKFLPSK